MFKLNKNEFNTWQEWIKKIQNLFYLSFSLPLVLFSITFLNYGENPDQSKVIHNNEILNTIVIVLITLVVAISYKVSFGKIKKFQSDNLREKLLCYQTEVNRFLLICNFMMLILTLFYFLSHNQIFALFFAIGLVLLSLEMPHPFKVGRRLKIPKSQLDKLMKGYEIDSI